MSQRTRCRIITLAYLICYLTWFQIARPDQISPQQKRIWANSSLTAAAAQLHNRHSVFLNDKVKTDLRRRITADVVRLADQGAREVLARKTQDDRFFFELGVDATRRNTAIFMHNLFISKNPSVTDELKDSGVLAVTATKELSKRLGLSKKELGVLSQLSDIPQPEFPCPFRIPRCNPGAKYRKADGSCNNLQNPIWGKAGTPLQRFLSPFYDDGVSKPRNQGVFGNLLPSARLVSTTIHEPDSIGTNHHIASHMVMQWGQFIDHDITNTPVDTGFQHSDISCCIDDVPEDVRKKLTFDLRNRESCFPIPIPPNDRHFTKNCLNFVRSMQAPNSQCNFGSREQLNQITSFIDGGAVYGISDGDQSQLRSHVQGQMKESSPHLLPKDPQQSCILTSTDNYCFKAGDRRVNEQMGLASIQTLFVREHNRIARQLSNMGLGWNDEKLFQETKRIVTAIIQRINYNEFLPTILNGQIMNSFGLVSPSSGFHNVYDRTVDPSIRNAFSTAAFRFGHSMVRSFFTKRSSDLNTAFGSPTLLKTMYGKTDEILTNKQESVDAFVRGLLSDSAQNSDRFISTQLTDHLFEDVFGNSLDLAAFNIQRGRDHGLPPYNIWRQWCGFSVASHFGIGPGGLIDHSRESAEQIKRIYVHPDDIDLFSGGLSENPIQDGVVGPTFACIIGRQFQILKIADRFWYERKDPTVGFTLNQLNEIRQMTLSKLICLNSNISQIQQNAFLVPDEMNRLVSCDSLPSMDLSTWGSCQQNTWGTWTPWSRCVGGQQVSRRRCRGVLPPIGCGCEGSSVKFRQCSGRRCRRPIRFNRHTFWVWARC